MAQSANFSTSNSNIQYHIVVTENSTDVSANTSNVHIVVEAWKLLLDDNSDNFDGECYVKIDGVQQTTATWAAGTHVIGVGTPTVLYEQDIDIAHNIDGTKSIQVAASFELYYMNAVRLSTGFQSFDVTLTDLDVANTELDVVGDIVADASTVQIISYVHLYKSYLHTLVIKNGNTTVLTLTDVELVDGRNTINLTSEQKSTLTSYLSTNGLSAFHATLILTTLSGSNQVGSTSSAETTVRTTPGTGTALVSFRSAGVGIKKTNPQYPLDVDGTVNCTTLIQSTPNLEVRNGHILKQIRW